VGQKKPNAWGVYDMHGNAPELCQGRFDGPFSKTPATNPKKPEPAKWSKKLYFVVRGGQFWWDAVYCRAARRQVYRYNGFSTTGLRLVMEAE
jgi:formylglycine-generating enzyme required for sulfatase activity